MSNENFSVVTYILCSILVLILSLFIFRIIINNPNVKSEDELSLENESGGENLLSHGLTFGIFVNNHRIVAYDQSLNINWHCM